MEDLNLFLDLVFKLFDTYFNKMKLTGIPLGYLLIAPILFKIVMNNLVLKAKSVKDTRKELTVNHGSTMQSQNKQ